MSDIKFACPTCQQHIQCGDGYAGMEIACPTCQSKMTVPRPANTPAPAPVPALALSSSAPQPPPMPPSSQASAEAGPTCPTCGNAVAPRAIMCVKCGTNLRTGQKMSAPGGRPGARPAPVAAGPSVWYKTLYPYLGAYMLVLVVTYLMAPNNPAMKITFLLILALYLFGAHIAVTVCAFKDDGMGKGFLCLCIGIYTVYYVLKESERPFLKVLYGIAFALGLAAKFGALDRLTAGD